MDDYSEHSVRNGRFLFGLLGVGFLVLGGILLAEPAETMPYGGFLCSVLGVGFGSLGMFAPKKVIAWLGEFIAIWP